MGALEQKYWDLDQIINERGVPIDMTLVDAALRLDRKHRAALLAEMKAVTGLANPNSNPQFLAWLQQYYDPSVADVTKETIITILQAFPPEGVGSKKVIKACELRQELAKSSVSKYKAIKEMVGADDRLRNLFQLYGASRTGRYISRNPQLHNLPSSMTDDPELYAAMVESIYTENPEFIWTLWGVSPSRILSQSIRGAIKAEPGNKLVVGDWGSIESRILGWLARCERINKLFAEGGDTYIDFAAELFSVPPDQVTKKQRKFAKPPFLGRCYGLGWRGLIGYAEGYGVDMDEDSAKHAIGVYDESYPEVKTLHKNYMVAIEAALTSPGQWYETGKVRMGKYLDMLLVRLPSGRFLHYYKPLWQQIPAPWDETLMIWGFTYEGIDKDDSYHWGRISAHAGKVTENFDQAIASDILREGLLEAEDQTLNPILHVHDEIGCEVLESDAAWAAWGLTGIMQRSPEWAPDLLLDGSVWIGDRYRKD